MAETGELDRGWTFLTNHCHVLLCLAADTDARLRDVARQVGITERAVQQIVTDLERAGYVVKERVGRRNHYTVVGTGRFRHPLEAGTKVGDFLDLVLGAARPVSTAARPSDEGARQGCDNGRRD